MCFSTLPWSIIYTLFVVYTLVLQRSGMVYLDIISVDFRQLLKSTFLAFLSKVLSCFISWLCKFLLAHCRLREFQFIAAYSAQMSNINNQQWRNVKKLIPLGLNLYILMQVTLFNIIFFMA